MSDHDLAVLGVLIAAVAIVLAAAPFGQWSQTALRWWRRRDPLRIEVSPHPHRDDAIVVTVANVGDEDLALAWCSVTGLSQTGPTSADFNGPDMHRVLLPPRARDDRATFRLERDTTPAGSVRWTTIDVFDMAGHHASARITPALSTHIERPAA